MATLQTSGYNPYDGLDAVEIRLLMKHYMEKLLLPYAYFGEVGIGGTVARLSCYSELKHSAEALEQLLEVWPKKTIVEKP